jgi:PAS domain S-box-containing protein
VREAELRLSLEKAQQLAEALEATNVALAQANRELERSIAERTAELEAANADLRRSEEHLRLVFESATEYAIFTVDTEGCVTSWNSGARRILGYEAEEILGQPGEVIFLPEDRAARAAEIELCKALEEGRAADDRWHLRKDGSRFWASGQVMPLRDASGTLRGFLKILRNQTERRRVEERGALLLRELDHRVKNTLAVVQAVAAQTLRQAGISPELCSAFDSRLVALARSHDMLAQGGWEGALLSEAVERTLEPYAAQSGGGGRASQRILTSGPPVRLASSTVVTLNLGLHELATNAVKYGALSVPAGRVEVTWRLERAAQPGAPPVLEILWRERSGPPVRPPERRGFGSRLLERGLAREAGGEVALDFLPEGVECRIRLPLPVIAP